MVASNILGVRITYLIVGMLIGITLVAVLLLLLREFVSVYFR